MSNFFNKLGFQAKNYAPEIMGIVGLTCMVTSTILALKAKPKADLVLAKSKQDYENCEIAKQKAAEDEDFAHQYTEEDYKNDRKIISIQTVKGLAFAYGPAILTGVAGAACILSGMGIMRSRYTAVTAAYSALNLSFQKYRERVKAKYGEEVEKAILTGARKEVVEVEETDPDTGEKTTKYEEREVYDDDIYTFVFDELNKLWDKDVYSNVRFLEGQLNWADHKLKTKGYLFLSEVLEALAIEPTRESFEIGWVYDLSNPDSDNFVSFGPDFDELVNARVADVIHMGRDGIRLHFNPDGCITYLFRSKVRPEV